MKRLALIAASHDLNFAIDAEEADRLVLSLKLIDRLVREPELGDWTGLGVVVQAYQKRGLAVIERLRWLAEDSGRRIMVRWSRAPIGTARSRRLRLRGGRVIQSSPPSRQPISPISPAPTR
jgi:RHH-type proline utilization regulon transcriptional repressor/proline dehydrogenase/delta 1-pyrroline-5-carboxylate dehydrogenase